MSNVSPLGDPHQYTYAVNNTNYDLTGSWSSGQQMATCSICNASVQWNNISTHLSWHEDLRELMNEELKEMAMGLAVEILKELAKQ